MKKRSKRFLIFFIIVSFLIVGLITVLFSVNAYVKFTAKDRIISEQTASELCDVDCILVLGCGVKLDRTPSDMLSDRLKVGISLYKSGAAPKLLMSGDHGRECYDEVNVMKQFAIDNEVPSADVFMDHAGFSTYESIYRAKEIFEAKKIIIVTQEYHLYRALYLAEKFDIEAYGVSADLQRYTSQDKRDFREVFARNKDFLTAVFKPKPTYLGDAIPVQNGNGDVTNDK